MDKIYQLLLKAKSSSKKPGVYLMKDGKGNIIYIGKAKNLSKRLISYFQPKINKTIKTNKLVKNIDSFSVIETSSENDALNLEASLIKEHQPKYNIKLKAGYGYPYLKIDLNRDFPLLEFTFNNKEHKKTIYFGPFPNINNLKDTIELINSTFKLRNCNDNTFNYRSRPCLMYQLKKCTAPCVQFESKIDYQKKIKKIIQILSGKSSSFIKTLNAQMIKESELENFEKAAEIRDQINNLNQIIKDNKGLINSNNKYNFNFIDLIFIKNIVYIGHLEINQGQIKGFYWTELDNFENLSEQELIKDYSVKFNLYNVISLYYKDFNKIIDKDWMNSLVSFLKLNLNSIVKTNDTSSMEDLINIQKEFQLQNIPLVIECVDISHFQGSYTVGSKVNFNQGIPDKTEYRRFRIKTIKGIDDYGSIKEVINRRFSNNEKFPDLMIIDGGHNQLKAAWDVLQELNIQGVDLIGLAKDKVISDFSDDVLINKGERICLLNGDEILLQKGSQSFKLFTQIRNEAHRFALKYHLELRKKHFLPKKNK